jgi:hypothetical protein
MTRNRGSHDRISSYPITYKHQAHGGDLHQSLLELITCQINEVKHEKEQYLGVRRILKLHPLLGMTVSITRRNILILSSEAMVFFCYGRRN